MRPRSSLRTRPAAGLELGFGAAARGFDDRVEFDGMRGAECQRFSISTDTLRVLDPYRETATPLQRFQAHQAQIHGVAARAFAAGAQGDPLQLHAAMFR